MKAGGTENRDGDPVLAEGRLGVTAGSRRAARSHGVAVPASTVSS